MPLYIFVILAAEIRQRIFQETMPVARWGDGADRAGYERGMSPRRVSLVEHSARLIVAEKLVERELFVFQDPIAIFRWQLSFAEQSIARVRAFGNLSVQ